MSARKILIDMWAALQGPPETCQGVTFLGKGALPSAFATSDFAAASTASAALALADLIGCDQIQMDRRLSSFWFAKSIRPVGWSLPPQWDPIAGNYRAKDGWVRLHTNAAHHRKACLHVLGCAADGPSVAACVADWSAQDLQEQIVAAGGVAAQMLSVINWQEHPQGKAVTQEPLVAWQTKTGPKLRAFGTPTRPLQGLRVLDLTRILAGPIATRFLAGFGADVLRIDPPGWDEPAVLAEVTPGKTRARLDLRQWEDVVTFKKLLREADVLVHGLRADALARLGLGEDERLRINPHLIDVALNAYGWTGPWAHRRGFDTIVQMSTGLAHAETKRAPSGEPLNLPVQALDYGTGHLMAAAVLRALSQARKDGARMSARFSLARTANYLSQWPCKHDSPFAGEDGDDLSPNMETTYWGQARRLKAPFILPSLDFFWSRPAGLLGDGLPRFGV